MLFCVRHHIPREFNIKAIIKYTIPLYIAIKILEFRRKFDFSPDFRRDFLLN